MKKMKRYLILMLCVLLFNSCGKFLEEFSQDLAYAESCADLDEILIGNGYMAQGWMDASIYDVGYYPYIHVMDDDVTMTIFKKNGSGNVVNHMASYKNFYDWSDQLTINPKTDEVWEDRDWEKMYSHIAYLNVIIAHVKKFSSGKSRALLPPSPLRTVRESFPSYGSSNSIFLFVVRNRLILSTVSFISLVAVVMDKLPYN